MAVFPQPMVVPDYGQGAVCDVLPAVCGRLGVRGGRDALDLPAGARWVVLLIDGLGDDLLAGAAEAAPFLAGLRKSGRRLTAGAPSTTVTSITSLGTGLPPGQHGMAGYSFRMEGRGILNALLWNVDLTGRDVQPRPTCFERAEIDGVEVSTVTPAWFRGTGLTESALRGGRFVGVPNDADSDGWVGSIAEAASRGPRTLVYAYERALDHIGHGEGVASPGWREVLTTIDANARRLREALPDDIRLVITADHGMLDIPGRNFLVLEEEPSLKAGVQAFAGEGRLRQCYTSEPAAVASRWRDYLGDHAWVRQRGEAIDEGWFGPVDDRVRERFGDVLVAMRTDWAVMSNTLPREFELIGMHGSLTPVEMHIPLLVT